MNTESFEKTRERVQRSADDAFKHHALTSEGDGRWLCRQDGRSEVWFRLITAPNAIVVLGDVGELVLRFQADPIPWLRGAVNSPDYLLEKVQASKVPPQEFYPVNALFWLEGHIDEIVNDDEGADVSADREELDALRIEQQGGELTQAVWLDACERMELDDMHDVGMYPSARMLWMIELLKCFIRLHDAENATAAA